MIKSLLWLIQTKKIFTKNPGAMEKNLDKYKNRKAKLIYQISSGGTSFAIEGIVVGGTIDEEVHLRALTSKEDSKGCAFPFKGKKKIQRLLIHKDGKYYQEIFNDGTVLIKPTKEIVPIRDRERTER